jgi:hypothetical protein
MASGLLARISYLCGEKGRAFRLVGSDYRSMFRRFDMLIFHCRHCGGNNGHRSRKRNLLERLLLPLFLVRPMRCDYCFRRQYAMLVRRVPERLLDASLQGKNSDVT